eukprot:14756541-Alexandrium_andersonii.AAC.1
MSARSNSATAGPWATGKPSSKFARFAHWRSRQRHRRSRQTAALQRRSRPRQPGHAAPTPGQPRLRRQSRAGRP